MELVYCSQYLERETKNTCIKIKNEIITLEKTIANLQNNRTELLQNRIEIPPGGQPPAGMRPVIVNNSMLDWRHSLRH